jgi:hypothetical protein
VIEHTITYLGALLATLFWILFMLLMGLMTDFSFVLFRPNFMLASEEYPMKAHKNQWFLNPLPPPDILWGATNQGISHGA